MEPRAFATYDELKKTDFWSVLHITESEAQPLENNQTVITLKPGWFGSEIHLKITTDASKQIRKGELSVKRSWVTGPPYGLNPMAIDTVRSFLSAVIPPHDREQVASLLQALAAMQTPELATPLLREGPRKSWLHEALFTYLGPSTSCRAPFRCSDLSMANTTHGDSDWLHLVVCAGEE